MKYYIETGSEDPCYNLAFEQYLLENKTEGDWLMLWQNDNTIVVGRNQNTLTEINTAFVEEHNIKVVRRITGGGAVYHDLGNLNYSFITDAEEDALHSIHRFTEPVCAALRKMGVEASASGRNDILVNGRKVSGVAQRICNGRILHHGTLLFDSDSETVSHALNVDPEKYQSKGAKSVRARIGNIRNELNEDMKMDQFWNALREELTGEETILPELAEKEIKEIQRIAEEKYRNWDWTYGKSPECNFKSKKRFPGGTLEINAQISRSRINNIQFVGDYMALEDSNEVSSKLKDCMFQRKEIEEQLSTLELQRFFGTISQGDIMDLLFPEQGKNNQKNIATLQCKKRYN